MRQLRISKQITSREFLSLDKYLNDINKIDLITSEEEVTLTRKIKKGDKMALNKLVRSNLRFVISVAKQYQNQGLGLEDLINEGNIGLIKAASRFDETKGFKFISYAVWWIRQSILQALAEKSRMVRLPLNKLGNISKVSKAYAELEQELKRKPTNEEIAKHLNLKLKEVKEALTIDKDSISMDAPLKAGEEEYNLHDMLLSNYAYNPEKEMEKTSMKNEVNNLLSHLSERDVNIIKNYYGLEEAPPLSLDEIGRKFGLTRERVRQIKKVTLKKLKEMYEMKMKSSFL